MADQTDLHPEVQNIAAKLTEAELSQIGSDVYDSWKYDRESRSGWEQKHAEWMELYYQQDKPINPPWPDASSESLPLLAEGCTQFHARSYKAMFPSQQIIKCVPTGKLDSNSKMRGERIGRHMSWQLMVQDRTYKKNKDRMLLSLPLHGQFYTKTFHDPVKSRNVVQNVRATDLVIPYGTGPREIDDIERKTQIIWMPMHKAAALEKNGYFSEKPEPYKYSTSEMPTDQASDEAQGVEKSPLDPNPPAMLLEQHNFLDLDDSGYSDPYIVTVCAQSKKVLRISIRWETDDEGNEINEREPIEYFTSYSYMENPDGAYGLGLGHLISQPNISVNKLLRQVVDASTLANVGNHSGFISEQLGGLQGGELEMSLGKFKKIPGSVDDIRNGIFQFSFPGPSATIPSIVELLSARSDRLATVTEAITGQTDKVMQPTTVMALIEQSLQVFTTVYERVADSWTSELEKLYRLNHRFLNEDEYFSVQDADGVLREYMAGKADYEPDLQVRPLADPRMATDQQRLAKAETVYNIMMQNPLVMNSPQHIYTNTKRMLQAIQEDNTEEILPNPSSQGLPRVDEPYQENMFVSQEMPQMPMAYPDQDHKTHIAAHAELLNNKEAGLSEFGAHLLEDHIRAHGRLMNGQSPSTGMAPGPDDAGGLGAAGTAISPDTMEGQGYERLDGGDSLGGLAGGGQVGGLGLPEDAP